MRRVASRQLREARVLRPYRHGGLEDGHLIDVLIRQDRGGLLQARHEQRVDTNAYRWPLLFEPGQHSHGKEGKKRQTGQIYV